MDIYISIGGDEVLRLGADGGIDGILCDKERYAGRIDITVGRTKLDTGEGFDTLDGDQLGMIPGHIWPWIVTAVATEFLARRATIGDLRQAVKAAE